jgi:hypothetical protein
MIVCPVSFAERRVVFQWLVDVTSIGSFLTQFEYIVRRVIRYDRIEEYVQKVVQELVRVVTDTEAEAKSNDERHGGPGMS